MYHSNIRGELDRRNRQARINKFLGRVQGLWNEIEECLWMSASITCALFVLGYFSLHYYMYALGMYAK